MLTSNLKVFIRHLLRKKLLTIINILGLSVGLGSVLVLALYVQDEWARDRQHPAAGYKYRIGTVATVGDEVLNIATSAPPAVPLLRENFVEIVDATRYYRGRFHVRVGGSDDAGGQEDSIGFADPNIGSFFSFEWRQGDPETAWVERNSIVLTEALAEKYFPDGEALGKTLEFEKSELLTVTGVIRDPALDSHLELAAIAPLEALNSFRFRDFFESWFNLDFFNYVQLAPQTPIETVWPAMATLLESSMPDTAQQIFDPALKPLTAIHLDTAVNPGTQRTRMDDVRVLVSISLAVLVLACINFINLATARAADRQKEIAVRKVAGASQRQIFLQHMLESCALVALALLLALGIAELSLPVVNSFTGKQLALGAAGNLWMTVPGIGLATAVLAGVWPAVYLSGFRPQRILRQPHGDGVRFFSFRNLLVVFQFAIAIVAIIAGIVMTLQLRFAQQRELGFDQEAVLVMENSPGAQWEVFKQQVRSQTGVTAISAALSRPFRSLATAMPVRYEGSELPVENLSGFLVDFGYFELFNVDLVAGRVFSEAVTKDRRPVPTEENPHPAGSVVLNSAMVQRLGWTPESALGKTLELQEGPGQDFARSVQAEVIGVVADMYVDSVQRSVVPQFFFVPSNTGAMDFLFLRLNGVDIQVQQASIAAIWHEIYPDAPANMYLLDDKFQVFYQRESRQTALLGLFALLAVFISCMGLIGLATYATEQRTKEVGIRKTIGANVLQIVMLFSADFSKLVLVSNVVAWPIAYIVMQRWLDGFAYRIDLTPLIFIGSGLIALCIAWVTVGGTAAKAASAKPVLALRYE